MESLVALPKGAQQSPCTLFLGEVWVANGQEDKE